MRKHLNNSINDGLTRNSITSGAKSKVKSSAQRAIRSKVLEEYPKLEPYIEDILPKKEQLDLVKLYAYQIFRVPEVVRTRLLTSLFC